MKYAELFEMVGLLRSVNDCAQGVIPPPLPSFSRGMEWYGFPPALLPVWVDGSGPTYYGVWHHWSERRTLTFVKMHLDIGRRVFEIARTTEQFFAYAVLKGIVAEDGISQRIQNFARSVGINDLTALDAATVASGDNPIGFVKLPVFANSTPLESCSDLQYYDGKFPTRHKLEVSASQSCTFEVPPEILQTWPAGVDRPEWLTGGAKTQLFNRFLKARQFEMAWFTLNSSGWMFREAAESLATLASLTEDDYLRALAKTWVPLAEKDSSGY